MVSKVYYWLTKLAKIKVSLDYNDTFKTPRGFKLAQKLISQGYDVYIVTRLNDRTRKGVTANAVEAGIKPENVFFTNGAYKWKTLKKLGIKRHYDNNPDEIREIQNNVPEIEAIKF